MDGAMPTGIANVGNSCFLNALLQCLCVPAAAGATQRRVADSKHALDMLVSSVVGYQPTVAHEHEPTRDFGHRGGGARFCGETNRDGAVMHVKTPLIREIFDMDLGLQGQQCPQHFFSVACSNGGVLAECFNATVGEVLTCGECGAKLNAPYSWTDNHVQILKFDAHTKALTLKHLILENIISAKIEEYSPGKHARFGGKLPSNELCRGQHGAHHVTYFSKQLPQHLCFALSSRSAGASKNTRYFAPDHHMELPEINYSASAVPDGGGVGTPSSVLYELYATITHSGRDSQGGHFSAYVLRGDASWFHVDDEHVVPVSAADVLDPPKHHTIYMLFYRRKTNTAGDGCSSRVVRQRTH